MLRRIGVGAFIVYSFLPAVTVFVLLGVATSWWLAGLFAGVATASMVVVYTASRSRGFLGRVIGTAGWDPLDYSQWTRYLVIRPLVVSLPLSFALIAAILLDLAFSPALASRIALYAASVVAGLAMGVVLWDWRERKRQRSEASERADRPRSRNGALIE